MSVDQIFIWPTVLSIEMWQMSTKHRKIKSKTVRIKISADII